MPGAPEPDLHRALSRAQLIRLLYRLGRQGASGVLTLTAPPARPEVFALRRGAAVCTDGELGKRALTSRLARAATAPAIETRFAGGVLAYPPGATHQVSLAGWVRAHLEAQVDGALAAVLARELAEARVAVRTELAPEPLDDADRRMLAALAAPRRLDQVWPLARAPRYRLLALVHFLRSVGALAVEGARAAEPAPPPRARDLASPEPRRQAALRLLGVDAGADLDAVKRAYRRLARTLHPDLQPHVDDQRRRVLEQRFAELTAAYEALV